jgi:hypothetical protein
VTEKKYEKTLDSRSPGKDFNKRYPNYEGGVLTTTTTDEI